MNIKKLIKFENQIDYFLFFIIIFKLGFIFSSLGNVVASHYNANKINNNLLYWKKRTEFMFVVSMAILLIIVFNPYKNVPIDENSSDLFFLFGIILLITANWNLFITEAKWYKKFISVIE